MLIDKPGDSPADQNPDAPEEHDSAGPEAKKMAVPQRKTKQQRRKAEKLRAEVHHDFFLPIATRRSLLSGSKIFFILSRNMLSWNARCANGCTHLSTLPSPCAKLATGR
jgi:hypothetical protein